MPTVQQMIELSDTLTKTQTRIFEYMLNHPEAVCYDTLRNTAERIGVTEVSVLKVCRKLGCSGYAEMKKVFRLYVSERLKDSCGRCYTLETVDDSSRKDRGALLRSMFETEQQGIYEMASQISEEQIFGCAQTLMNAREVLLFGHDVSKVMADYFAHRLNYLRIKAVSLKLGDSDTVQTSLAMAGEDDVIVLFSFPPYYQPVSNVARYAAYRGAKVITITDRADSPAVMAESCNFICGTKTKFFFNSLTAPISLVNILTSCIALEMGSTLDRILEEELSVSRFMSGEFTEEGERKNRDADTDQKC